MSAAKANSLVEQLSQQTDPEKVRSTYEEWSSTYEEDLSDLSQGYQHPQKIARVVAAHLQDTSCRVIDVCAGTGLGGQALQQLGFSNVDAIDGSSGMLEKAHSKQVYRQLFHELIGPDGITSFPEGSYDAAVTSGSFLPGHLGPQHLQPILQAIRPGGLFVMALREAWLESEYLSDLEPQMARMEEAGLWQRIAWETMENYHSEYRGKVYVYRRL